MAAFSISGLALVLRAAAMLSPTVSPKARPPAKRKHSNFRKFNNFGYLRLMPV